MLNFNMFKFTVIQGSKERARRKENSMFLEIVEKFKPHIRRWNIISGNIYFKGGSSDEMMKAFYHCYAEDSDDGEMVFRDVESRDYTFHLGQGGLLQIDNVDPWLEKD